MTTTTPPTAVVPPSTHCARAGVPAVPIPEALAVLAARTAGALEAALARFLAADAQNLGHLETQAAHDVQGLLRTATQRGAQAKADATLGLEDTPPATRPPSRRWRPWPPAHCPSPKPASCSNSWPACGCPRPRSTAKPNASAASSAPANSRARWATKPSSASKPSGATTAGPSSSPTPPTTPQETEMRSGELPQLPDCQPSLALRLR